MDLELPEKFLPLLEPWRYKVAYGGRDGGKSWTIGRTLLALGLKSPLRILCAREVQRSIKDSVYKLLVDQIERLGLTDYYEILSQEIRGRNGTLFLFAGLSDQTAASLKSYEGVDIVWCEEAQTLSKGSLRVLIPTIRKKGSEIWMTFNPGMDTDEVYKRFVLETPDDCALMQVNWYDNPWASEALESERERLRATDPDEFAHVWEGQCKPAVEGAIYYREVSALRAAGRLCNVPYDPMLRVHVVCDLGFNDYMSLLLCQRLGSEIRVIKYIEDRQRFIPSYSQELRELGMNWGTLWLPHDGANNYVQGESAYNQFTKLGWHCEIVDDIGLEQGIRKAREVFHRVVIDKTQASELLNRLGRYRRRINGSGQATTPMHDDESHGADGFRYLSIVADQFDNGGGSESAAEFYGAFKSNPMGNIRMLQ